MGKVTAIEWTDSTWSPNKGCSRVSPGCVNCYAERLAGRFCGSRLPLEGFATLTPSGARWTGRVEIAGDRLAVPVRWKAPRRVFVNSQSDTFHEELSNEDVAAVFGAIAAAPQHAFQVLTKRSKRMRDWFAWLHHELVGLGRRFVVPALIEHAAATARKHGDEEGADRLCRAANERAGVDTWPLTNVCLGVSVETQGYEARVEDLCWTPAAQRFLSVEPLLGAMSLRRWLLSHCDEHDFPGGMCTFSCRKRRHGIDWVIVGGESGHAARPMHPDWARAIRDECDAAGVPFFFKQWGEWAPSPLTYPPNGDHESGPSRANRYRIVNRAGGHGFHGENAICMERVGKKAAGALLDGREHKASPVAEASHG